MNMQTETPPKDLKQALNIPEYDETKYPRLNDIQMEEAGLFMYQLSLIGACTDRNLQNLLWHLYLQLSNVIKETGMKTEEERQEKLMKAIKNLKTYVKDSKNPVFKTLAEHMKQ